MVKFCLQKIWIRIKRKESIQYIPKKDIRKSYKYFKNISNKKKKRKFDLLNNLGKEYEFNCIESDGNMVKSNEGKVWKALIIQLSFIR